MAEVRTVLAADALEGLAAMAHPALEGIGPDVVDAARAAAPILTGELVESIAYFVTEEGGVPVLYVAAGTGGLADYAAFVELGTSRMAAQPYLQPAAMRRWL